MRPANPHKDDRGSSARSIDLCGEKLTYCMCRVLPDSALVLRDVMREADRLWARELGADRYAELKNSPEGAEFFTARVRLEPVPPEREMVAVWLPFPSDFASRLKPQLVDYVEAVPQSASPPIPDRR